MVDFPLRSCMATRPRYHHHPVHFSEFSEMYVIKSIHDVDSSELWNTARDKERLRRELAGDIVSTREALLSAMRKRTDADTEVLLTEEEFYRLVGIEHLLTAQRVRAVRYRRRQHEHTVISNQDVCTPETLSLIAMRDSKQARTSAYEVAVNNWNNFQQTSV